MLLKKLHLKSIRTSSFSTSIRIWCLNQSKYRQNLQMLMSSHFHLISTIFYNLLSIQNKFFSLRMNEILCTTEFPLKINHEWWTILLSPIAHTNSMTNDNKMWNMWMSVASKNLALLTTLTENSRSFAEWILFIFWNIICKSIISYLRSIISSQFRSSQWWSGISFLPSVALLTDR